MTNEMQTWLPVLAVAGVAGFVLTQRSGDSSDSLAAQLAALQAQEQEAPQASEEPTVELISGGSDQSGGSGGSTRALIEEDSNLSEASEDLLTAINLRQSGADPGGVLNTDLSGLGETTRAEEYGY